MPTATAKPKRTRRFLEDLQSESRGYSGRVDKAAGIIFGVKVLGHDSQNKRRYLPECIKSASKFYEGINVNKNHPDKPTDSRKSEDRIGWLENVRVTDDGLRADLHLLLSDPLTRKLLEAAEKRPSLFGLSHNAQGNGEDKDGVFEVCEITEVRSVDIVADGATTKSLFESRNQRKTMKRKIREVLENLLPALPSKVRKLGKTLLEMPEDELAPMDAPMEAPPEEDMPPPIEDDAGAGEDWKTHLTNAIAALVGSEDPASHDIAAKILRMLKPETATVAEEDESEEKEEETTEGEEEDKKEEETVEECEDDKGKMESKKHAAAVGKELQEAREELKLLKREKSARKLCKQYKVDPDDDVLMEALLRCPDDAAMGRLLKREEGRASPRKAGSSIDWKPRPTVTSKTNGKSGKDSFLESIRAN